MAQEPQIKIETENAVPFRTPAEWSALDGVTVMDPDGWRGNRVLTPKSWEEPINRAEWDERMSLSTYVIDGLSAVDRLAIRLYRLNGGVHGPATPALVRRWNDDLKEYHRKYWRDVARTVLADIALGDDGDLRAWPDYEVRHPDGDVHGGYDDIGSASDFQANVWPGGKIYRRTVVSVSSEWTEVTV